MKSTTVDVTTLVAMKPCRVPIFVGQLSLDYLPN